MIQRIHPRSDVQRENISRALATLRRSPVRQHGNGAYWHPVTGDGDPIHHSTLLALWRDGLIQSDAEDQRKWKAGTISLAPCDHFFKPGLDTNPRCTGCGARFEEIKEAQS